MGAVGLIVERIPHKDVSYAYLEIQASNANEFEALREEALKKIPQYAFALSQPSAPKAVPLKGEPPQEARERAQSAEAAAAVEIEVQPAPASSAPTGNADQAPSPTTQPTEGLSPRELARQRVAAKKGA